MERRPTEGVAPEAWTRSAGLSTRASSAAPRLLRSRGVTILTPTSSLPGGDSLDSSLPNRRILHLSCL